jgi:hypothetical protein
MNNLSASIAQQQPPPVKGVPPVSRASLVDAGRQWALKALDIGAGIKSPEREEECDMGCAVATHNLGEFAEMDGNIVEARRRYEEAASLSSAIGFRDGVIQAKEGLKRLGSS